MPVSIRDARNSPEGRNWIQSVFREYLDDLTRVSMNTGVFPVIGEFGDREPDLLARWFSDDSAYPLVILKDQKPVGFAVVSRPSIGQRNKIDFRLSEFFIVATQRRLGIGRDAANLIFRRFAGRWEITELQHNKAAIAFWRDVVAGYTGGKHREFALNGEIHQQFESTSAGQP